MERTKLAAVPPADLGCSDVGSWASVWDVLNHDAAGNDTGGPVVVMDSRNALVCTSLRSSCVTDLWIVSDPVSRVDAIVVSVEGLKFGRSSRL
jgi:mannose-1-phosphate guanylyltransferase